MPFPNEYRGITQRDALAALERAFVDAGRARRPSPRSSSSRCRARAASSSRRRSSSRRARDLRPRTASCSSPTRCRPASGAPGRMFAIEHFGVEPDLMTVAKSIAAGLPLSGVLGKAEIMDAPGDSAVGGTYVGNPVAQAAALAVLDVFEEEGLVERAERIGETIRGRMLAWQERHPADRRRARARRDARDRARRGIRATKAPAPELATRVAEEAAQRGLLLLKAGIHSNCIRVLCPLVITDAELDEALGAWEEALEAFSRSLGTPAFYLRAHAPFSPCPVVGDVIAERYELEELVGTGGMSSVFRAHDRLLERHVALKVLHAALPRRRGVRRALQPGGPHRRAALAPEHRHGHRPRRGRRPAIHRLRVHRRREPQGADRSPARCRVRRAVEFAIESPTRSRSRTSTGSSTATSSRRTFS